MGMMLSIWRSGFLVDYPQCQGNTDAQRAVQTKSSSGCEKENFTWHTNFVFWKVYSDQKTMLFNFFFFEKLNMIKKSCFFSKLFSSLTKHQKTMKFICLHATSYLRPIIQKNTEIFFHLRRAAYTPLLPYCAHTHHRCTQTFTRNHFITSNYYSDSSPIAQI